ncbi:unnamed protein product [Phytophthora fragariaefolia]|uniref:Unnamed protein product n=1 Tax=Phytophthora fragariaefolia TaxID=1490495 RepID=A0A9W6YNF8_9STRA|nr:unnamed protein product [Phytophthora fragariaefolia]
MVWFCFCTQPSLRPYVKISYASKPISSTAFKAGQGATFQKEFDAAAAPVETDGFCERVLTSLGPLLNSQSDLCGRFKQVDTNVGFLLQVEFVEPNSVSTSWTWFLGLPFRLGNGAVVVLDGVIVQDIMGKSGYWKGVLAKAVKVDMQITPGFHTLQIYGLSAKFETTSVYFSRDGSTPAVVSVTTLTKPSNVGRGVSTLQFQSAPVEGRFALHLSSIVTSDVQDVKGNTSSLISFSFIPTTSWSSAKAFQVGFLTAASTKWVVIPGLTISLSYPTGGVLLCSFTGRFTVDKRANTTFSLDLAFGSTFKRLLPQFHLDEGFVDSFGVPLDFSYFTDVSESGPVNVSLNYQYQGTKTGKIIGGRTTSVFIPGASLVTDTFADRNVNLTTKLFSRTISLPTSSTLIIRVAGIICRNSATETFRARILKNEDAVFDGEFASVSGAVANGTCEPFTMHSIVDAIAGSHAITVIGITSTAAGYLLKGLQWHIVVVERGALLSQEQCQSRCARHNLCRLGIYNTMTMACNLYMMRNTSSLASDSTRVTFVLTQETTFVETPWTIIRNTKWSLTQNLSMETQCQGEGCGCSGVYTLQDRCRCRCLAIHDCTGFLNSDGSTCYAITATDLRQNIQAGTYNTSGSSTIHLNMPHTCHAVKIDFSSAPSGPYAIATSTGLFHAFCNMTADSGEGYTLVPCDMGTNDVDCLNSGGPKDFDSCKVMGLQQVVPRSSGHFVSMHQKFGSLYFSTVPGITNGYVGDNLELPSDEDSNLEWTAIDGGKWWLRDNGDALDVKSPPTAPDESRWLGMHYMFNGESVFDGLVLSFDPRGLTTAKYLCSTNGISPSVSWSPVLQDSFIGSGDDNMWLTSWSNTDKWYQLCQGIVLLGGKAFARTGSYVNKTVTQVNKGDKPASERIRFTYYFVFDPLYWITLLLKSSEPKIIRQTYFYRGRERFVVRGFSGNATQLRFEVDFGILNVTAFGVDEVSMEVKSSFVTSIGLSIASPAVSCTHLKNERISKGDPNPDGLYCIQLDPNTEPVLLPCSDGWIVAQRRINGKTTFNRNWDEYREGFGIGSSSEWWIGNKHLAAISVYPTEAMVVISKDYQSKAAIYTGFRVANENEKFLLTVKGYNSMLSDATDALSPLKNMYFSTPDQDNDMSPSQNCAKNSRSGFWYGDCHSSVRSDLNAPFSILPICTSYAAWAKTWCQKTGSIVWDNVDGYDSSILMLRPDRCSPGYYLSNTAECLPCPTGTYSEQYSQECVECPEGTYNPSAGLAGNVSCLSCPSGFMCTSGSTAPVKCLAGSFSDAGSRQCLNVPEGYVGPLDQMSRNDLLPCMNGTFSKPGQRSCTNIPGGFYCPVRGSPCGYSSLTPCSSRNVYCPPGNLDPVPVPPGYYSTGSMTNEQQSAILLCPRGYYCRKGISYPCPPTRFGDQLGQVATLCSGRCGDGCVCKAGSIVRCPNSPMSLEQVALSPSSIVYHLAPLTRQPGITNESLLDEVMSAISGISAISMDVFDFQNIGLALFRTRWSVGFAHNITISYFEQSHIDLNYEFQVPSAGFDWGVVVIFDGITIVPRATSGSLAFSFVSSWGQHDLSIIAAESQFTVKRSILYRKSTLVSFTTLRCDRFDGQLVFLDIDIALCGAVTPTRKGTVNINGETVKKFLQVPDTLEVLIYSGLGTQIASTTSNISASSTYLPLLSTMKSGDIAVLVGVNTGLLPSSFRSWLSVYGILQSSIDSAVSGFVFIGINDAALSSTFEAITAGSDYNLMLSLPLVQSIAYYNYTSIPDGYYGIPDDSPDTKRCGIKKCVTGYNCTKGVRSLSYVFPSSVCVDKKQNLDIFENDPAFVSSISFSLLTAPAGLTYSLEVPAPNTSFFTLDSQNHIMLLKSLDYEADSTYDIILMLQDTQASHPYAACQIHINVLDLNEVPVITNSRIVRTIKENLIPPVILAPALSVDDPDSYDSYVFSIANGGDEKFVVNRDGSIVATKILDYETASLFTLDVIVTDRGGLKGYASVVVSVLDLPELPSCSSRSLHVSENTTYGTVIGNMSDYVSELDAGDYVVYQLVAEDSPSTLSIDTSTGTVTLMRALDFEVQDTISFRVLFMDTAGFQCTCDYVINVTDSNDLPVFASAIFQVPEKCTGKDCLAGDLARYVEDDDVSDVLEFSISPINSIFQIQGSELWVVGTLDFESTPVLTTNVFVDDGRGGNDQAFITVEALDINEAPIGSVFEAQIFENVPIGTVVCTFEAYDPEGDDITYSIVKADTEFEKLFSIKDGELVTNGMINYEVLSAHSFRAHITACDPLMLCSEFGPSAIEILDGPDAPVVTTDALQVTLLENATVGSSVGINVSFSDEDNGQESELFFSIYSGDPLNQFTISNSSGDLSVISPLDAKVRKRYALIIQATDLDGLVGLSDPIWISASCLMGHIQRCRSLPVGDRDPGQSGGVCSIVAPASEGDRTTDSMCNVVCEDASGKNCGGSKAHAVYQLGDSLDFEKRRQYELIIMAIDNGYPVRSTLFNVSIDVNDINEPPTLTAMDMYVEEGFRKQLNLSSALTIRDEDTNDTAAYDPDQKGAVEYAIVSQSIDGCLQIGTYSGQISVLKSSCFDYESFVFKNLETPEFTVATRTQDGGTFNVTGIRFLGDSGYISYVELLYVRSTSSFTSFPAATQTCLSARVDMYGLLFFPVNGREHQVSNGNIVSGVVMFALPRLNSNHVLDVKFKNTAWLQLFDVSMLRKIFLVEIIVHDSATESLSTKKAFEIVLLDQNEPPQFILVEKLEVLENVPSGTPVYPVLSSMFGDPEGSKRLEFSLEAQSIPGTFYYDSSTSQLHVGERGINFEEKNVHSLVITVMDEDIVTKYSILVTVLDTNDPPTATCLHIHINENAQLDKELSSAVLVFDEDALDTEFTYHVRHETNWFSINKVGRLILKQWLDFGRIQYTPPTYLAIGYLFQDAAVPFTLNMGTFVNDLAALDYEQQSIYDLTVGIYYSTTDYISCSITIRVLDINEPPMCTLQVAHVWENGVGGSIFIEDQGLLNYETCPYYSLYISVSDGVNTVACPIIVSVIDMNDCPSIPTQTRYIYENSPVGTAVGDPITVRDEDYGLSSYGRLAFSVDSRIFSVGKYSGLLVVSDGSMLDYEVLQEVRLTVYVTDDAPEPCTSNATIIIHIVDVNEPPVLLAGQVALVPEFTKTPSQDPSIPVLVVAPHDQDKNDTIRFSLTRSSTSDMFRVDRDAGSVFINDATVFDYESCSLYFLDVIVTDLSGLSNVERVEIGVIDLNVPPIFLIFRASIDENSANNTVILKDTDTITFDPEGDNVKITIIDQISEVPFAVVENGLVLVSEQLDYEVRASYVFSILACDTKGLCTSGSFTVVVNDINEPPVIQTARLKIREDATEGSLVGSPLLAWDPDLG